jgi:hypothetical protein
VNTSERAKYHLHRRRGATRSKAEPQTKGLFAEPKRQFRQFMPLAEDAGLFTEPAPQARRLVTVNGWPDYRSEDGGG